MLAAAQVAAAVARDTARAHGVLHARVDGAGVRAIGVTHLIGERRLKRWRKRSTARVSGEVTARLLCRR